MSKRRQLSQREPQVGDLVTIDEAMGPMREAQPVYFVPGMPMPEHELEWAYLVVQPRVRILDLERVIDHAAHDALADADACVLLSPLGETGWAQHDEIEFLDENVPAVDVTTSR